MAGSVVSSSNTAQIFFESKNADERGATKLVRRGQSGRLRALATSSPGNGNETTRPESEKIGDVAQVFDQDDLAARLQNATQFLEKAVARIGAAQLVRGENQKGGVEFGVAKWQSAEVARRTEESVTAFSCRARRIEGSVISFGSKKSITSGWLCGKCLRRISLNSSSPT